MDILWMAEILTFCPPVHKQRHFTGTMIKLSQPSSFLPLFVLFWRFLKTVIQLPVVPPLLPHFANKLSRQMEPATSAKPCYFDLFRQFGKHGFDISDARFDYSGRGCESQPPTLHQILDISSVPYSMLTRFIQLIPSPELRRLSFSNKYFYGKCLEARGIEVQIIYLTYNVFGIVPKLFPLKNGRLVVEIQPYRNLNRKMLPYFRTTALFVDCRGYCPRYPMHDKIAKNYSQFYGLINCDNDWSVHQHFLHDQLDTVELKIYRDDDVNVFELIPKLQQIKTKHFSFEFFTRRFHSRLDEIEQLLIKNKQKCDHFYFCYCTKENYYLAYNQCIIRVYDNKTRQFKTEYSPDLSKHSELVEKYQKKYWACNGPEEKSIFNKFLVHFQSSVHVLL